MKTVGNLMTILFTIFLPVIAILSLGVPMMIKLIFVAAFTIGFYQLIKNYVLAKFLSWNGYSYWYVKRLLTVKEYRLVVRSLSDYDHLRLQAILSTTEYAKILRLIPEDERQAIMELHKRTFHPHGYTKHAF
ncbi:hypothetical protein [Companilactobacillus furfuricola]|uniref:hypothetical protein n=1 Tax=Companilactobacillus furfuricola TaxID=1462575 RepID=UPI000F768ABB|nr:hypothetical protein [Companilactobacillus furfuricola]